MLTLFIRAANANIHAIIADTSEIADATIFADENPRAKTLKPTFVMKQTDD